MGLLLIVHQLVFPPLVIELNQFQGRLLALIQQVGDQAMCFSMAGALRDVQSVFDDAHHDAVAILFAAPTVTGFTQLDTRCRAVRIRADSLHLLSMVR